MSADAAGHKRWQPRRPQPRGEQRRTRLLAALEKQLQSRPLADISIADVADEAGLGRSAFYFYFTSKHEAVTQLLGDLFDRDIAGISELLDRDGDPRDNIAEALAFTFHTWDEHKTLLCAVLDARDGDSDARLIWDRWIDGYEEFTGDFIARTGVGISTEPAVLAHTLIAMNERVLERHIRSGGNAASATELHASIVHVWTASILGAP